MGLSSDADLTPKRPGTGARDAAPSPASDNLPQEQMLHHTRAEWPVLRRPEGASAARSSGGTPCRCVPGTTAHSWQVSVIARAPDDAHLAAPGMGLSL